MTEVQRFADRLLKKWQQESDHVEHELSHGKADTLETYRGMVNRVKTLESCMEDVRAFVKDYLYADDDDN